MKNNAKAMVLGAFAADSLALGAHWIYDTDEIANTFGRVETFQKPAADSYHPTKDAGQFTHYGDQTLVLLESLAACQGFELNHFAGQWRKFHSEYDGYFDQATRSTLANFESGENPASAGSRSADLGGASRIAPLAYVYRNNAEQLIQHARIQTAMTHNNPQVVDASAFFASVVFQVLDGAGPTEAIRAAAGSQFNREPFSAWVSKGLESQNLDTREAIRRFGQMCETPAAFPSVIHLIVKYQENLKEALVQNVMAGGDSAARGLLTAMVLGAYQGLDAIPENWLTQLEARPRILQLLAQIDQNR
jgi:ADP-ribosylglycohydrolase